MTLCDYTAHHVAIPLRHPPQREKRGLGPVLVEDFKYRVYIALDAARHMVPGVARDVGRKGGDLEIIFHVYGQCVPY